MRLQNKTAVITGAAGDIGFRAATRFAEEGARLALLDLNEQSLVERAKSMSGSSPLLVPADISDEDAIRGAAERVRSEYGTIDVLFANAGIEQSHVPLVDMEKADFDRIIAINLTGAFLTAKHFAPLLNDNGSVIITSSIAGLVAFPSYSAYCASKAGVIGLMRSAAADWAVRGIRCNTIHPGNVKSTMLERSAQMATGGGSTDGFYSMLEGMAKLRRLVQPDDVVSLALFLASDESTMITGQSIAVDGGVVE